MPSGPVMCSRTKAASVWPLTTSTTRPRTSVDMPYSQVSPGWATSGSCASLVMNCALVNLPLNRPASRYIFLMGCSVPANP